MTENFVQRKRARVTYGVLDFYTSGPMSTAASEELYEIKAEQKTNQELINTLERQNVLLNSQIKAINGGRNAETVSKDARIQELRAKNAEAEARAVYHMKANKETTEALEEAKSELIRKANQWESREKILLSEIEDARKNSYRKINEYGKLMIEKEKAEKETAKKEKEKEIKIKQLNETIDLMSCELKDKNKIVENMKNHVTELEKQIELNRDKVSTEQTNDYDKLELQFTNVCEKNKTLSSENKKATRKLRHYAAIEDEMKQYNENDNLMTIEESFSKMAHVHKENKQLIHQIAQLKGEMDTLKFHLKVESTQSLDIVIREISKKLDEAEGVKIENRKLEEIRIVNK